MPKRNKFDSDEVVKIKKNNSFARQLNLSYGREILRKIIK